MFKRLKELLGKLADGTISDEEKTELTAMQATVQQTADHAAAEARRKAEEAQVKAETVAQEADERAKVAEAALRDKEEANKPEVEKLQGQVERLEAQVAERDATIEGMKTEAATAARETALDAAVRKTGVEFIPGVDAEAQRDILKGRIGELDVKDFGDEAKTKPIVDAFVAANEAIVVDDSGHGSGGKPRQGGGGGGGSKDNPYAFGTWNLTEQGELLKSDPELAKRLQSEAGNPKTPGQSKTK